MQSMLLLPNLWIASNAVLMILVTCASMLYPLLLPKTFSQTAIAFQSFSTDHHCVLELFHRPPLRSTTFFCTTTIAFQDCVYRPPLRSKTCLQTTNASWVDCWIPRLKPGRWPRFNCETFDWRTQTLFDNIYISIYAKLVGLWHRTPNPNIMVISSMWLPTQKQMHLLDKLLPFSKMQEAEVLGS